MTSQRRRFLLLTVPAIALATFATSLSPSVVLAADAPAKLAGGRADLPQAHEYQKVLHKYMATLTEKDFDHGVTTDIGAKASSTDPEYQYRNYIYTQSPHPLVGSKRGTPAINAPPALFTLAKVETPEGIFVPPGYAEATISLVQWDYPGNPYHNNRGLKMRCFVGSAIHLVMLDDYLDKNPLLLRTDRISYWLVRTGAAYPAFKDQLPADVQKAYQDGTRKLAERLLAMSPKGEEPNMDLAAPVGLSYAARVLNDPEFAKRAEDWSRKVFTDPKYLHPAGYWVERGGLDINFSGTTNYFAVWAALMNDWPFANEAVGKLYRLRAHLMLPEPSGKFTGPTAFNSRTGGAAIGDQWDYANRDRGAAMITDELAFLNPIPKTEELEHGGAGRAQEYGRQIAENPRAVAGQNIFQSNQQIGSNGWGYSLLPNYNFPASVNPAFEFYKKGSFAHLKSLAEKNSPMLKSPYLRGENFVRDFGKAFIIARQPSFAAIIHTGPVAEQKPDDGLFQFSAPLGYGGGQLSAFWTPATGSVILGRRAGQAFQVPFEKLADWRNWPIHAVSGVTADGKIFTSGRITKPDVTAEVKDRSASVKVSGSLVAFTTAKDPDEADKTKARDLVYDGPLGGKIDYARSFKIDDKGVSIETTVSGDGKDQVAELVETIPVFFNDPLILGAEDPKVTIEFEVGGKPTAATDAYVNGVTAIRITRFGGAITVKFDKARRVKLSPAEFKDVYVSRAICRSVMVDLLESGDKPAAVTAAKKVGYRIEAAGK